MDDKTLFSVVVRHIGEFLETDVSQLKPSSRLATEIDNLTSLKLYELMLYLEDCLGIKIDDGMIENLETMQDLVTYIQSKSPQVAATTD